MFRYGCASGNTSFKQSALLNKQRSYDPTEADNGSGTSSIGLLADDCILYQKIEGLADSILYARRHQYPTMLG